MNSVIVELATVLGRDGSPAWLEGLREFRVATAHCGSPTVEQRRAYRCADWAARAVAPIALDSYGMSKHAAKLRALREVADRDTATAARLSLGGVKGAITRKLGSSSAPVARTISDPAFVAWMACPAARVVVCASHSLLLARVADDRANGRAESLEEGDVVESDVLPSECLAGAAVYAARAAVITSESFQKIVPDHIDLLRQLAAM